ncbi:hypothetical protein CDEST_00068 [Colletotrichum destructivum]|uniref:Uncharacterized protein n=1 Tax=Colletotrichum destructivum TaxID=34406 RepID=A0AAX4HWB5_9PEZI|nr:hypothetical protein CDEST_00068 [Colletotrichum destructivum]
MDAQATIRFIASALAQNEAPELPLHRSRYRDVNSSPGNAQPLMAIGMCPWYFIAMAGLGHERTKLFLRGLQGVDRGKIEAHKHEDHGSKCCPRPMQQPYRGRSFGPGIPAVLGLSQHFILTP